MKIQGEEFRQRPVMAEVGREGVYGSTNLIFSQELELVGRIAHMGWGMYNNVRSSMAGRSQDPEVLCVARTKVREFG